MISVCPGQCGYHAGGVAMQKVRPPMYSLLLMVLRGVGGLGVTEH
jgi:hypothetical protein